MRRWFHNRFNRHRWTEVTHRHNVEIDGEQADYAIVECSCGMFKEIIMIRETLPTGVPGINLIAVRASVTTLSALDEAKVWAEA